MADNVTLSAGTADGAVIATDDITSVHYQIIKLGFGALNSVTLASAGAGAVDGGVQRVTLASDDPAVALLGTIDADTGGMATSLAIMDDWDNGASDGASVSGDVAHDAADAGEPLKIGGYAKAAAPTAVSLDGDRVNAWFLLNGAQTVVLTAAGALIGGDAANGLDVDVTRLPALVAGTANIGDVDVLTVPAPLSTTGGGTEATALRVTVASDSTGVLSVDDNGAALTVDWAGTAPPIGAGVEATALRVTLATDSTGLVSVDDGGGALTVDGTVTANLAAGTNNIGDVDVLSIAAGDNNIGNVDIVTIAAGSTLIGDVGLQPRTSGGLTIFRSIDIDESEEEVKAPAGQLSLIPCIQKTAAPLYLKFYNLTAANTTVGASTPVLTLPVPANADSDGSGFTVSIPQGLAFDTAISVACTTGVADADTGAPGANDCIINLGYK